MKHFFEVIGLISPAVTTRLIEIPEGAVLDLGDEESDIEMALRQVGDMRMDLGPARNGAA